MRRLKQEIWPYKITLTKSDKNFDFYEIEQWLGENTGLWKDRWAIIYFSNKSDVYFKDGKDATMFALRWS